MKRVIKIAFLVMFLVIALFIFAVVLSAAQSNAPFYVKSNDFIIYPTNNTFVIPSGINEKKIAIYSQTQTFNCDNKTYTNGTEFDITSFQKMEQYDSFVYVTSLDGKQYYFIKEPNLPYMSIDTTVGFKNFSRNVKDSNTQIVAYETSGKIIYSDITNETVSEMKVRGNATSGYQKKPYQIKLGKKADLFGLGKAKTYILLANYIDPSFIRNYTTFSLADYLNMDFSPKSQHILLYVDGNCAGLYQLSEKTQINQNRIEIDNLEDRNGEIEINKDSSDYFTVTVKNGELIKRSILTSYSFVSLMESPDDYTGGYLIELDNLYSASEKCKFSTSNGNTYVIKSPEEASEEEVEYIAELFADMEEALYSKTGYNSKGKHFSEYIDIDSFAKMYTIEELTKDWDAFVGSNYFYKDKDTNGIQSKIYAGPVWDFDNSWGSLESGSYAKDYTEIWTDTYKSLGRPNANNNLGKAISSQPILKDLISKYTKIAGEKLLDYISPYGFIDTLAQKLNVASTCDKIIWGYTNRQGVFIVFKNYNDDSVSNSAISYLKNFISIRTKALLNSLSYELNEIEYSSIEFELQSYILNSTYFKTGEQASFIYTGDKNIQILDNSGNEVEYENKGGVITFIMAQGGVIVKEKDSFETTSVSTTIIETIETTKQIDTTQTTEIDQTSAQQTTNVDNDQKKNNDILMIVIICALIIVVTCVSIILVYKKKGGRK